MTREAVNLMNMTQLNPYLTFNGNCHEAMNFYRDCLGGELAVQTIGESPMAPTIPEEMKHYILHAVLVNPALTLMATDCVGPDGLTKGNSISLCINCASEEEIRMLYKRLSEGGAITQPLMDTFWGALFGGLTDKYGNHWLLNYSKNIA